MNRIDLPDWARKPEVWLDGMRLSDYYAIQGHRERILKLIHGEVEAYLNTPGLYQEEPEQGFPNRSRMTGDYYVSDESYAAHVGPVWIQVGILCHCLGKRVSSDGSARDYLGLQVWLRCDPVKWTFKVFRNTDSSVI